MNNIRPVAFYLPQFYPTPENDEWWEPGFTEWTNVAKAKPLFKGHYQPRIPRDLGFYDLRLPSVREKQTQMAREAGIEGFCYWHYWFGNGRRLLDQVFREVVETGKPDFPFCLCWANHSWKAKTWNPNVPDKMLMEQLYPGEEDYIAHFNAMLPAFKDKRYIRINGKLLFGVFDPLCFDAPQLFFDTWNRLAVENGLGGFYFFCLSQGHSEKHDYWLSLGYDNIVFDALNEAFDHPEDDGMWKRLWKRFQRKFIGKPYTVDYNNYIKRTEKFLLSNPSVIPCIDPDFDHSPRSGKEWIIVEGSTPEKWKELCQRTIRVISERADDTGLLFIKSWNEWGEGNYLEPDRKWGDGYLRAVTKLFSSKKN